MVTAIVVEEGQWRQRQRGHRGNPPPIVPQSIQRRGGTGEQCQDKMQRCRHNKATCVLQVGKRHGVANGHQRQQWLSCHGDNDRGDLDIGRRAAVGAPGSAELVATSAGRPGGRLLVQGELEKRR